MSLARLRAWLLYGARVPGCLVLGFMRPDYVLALAAASAGYLVIAGEIDHAVRAMNRGSPAGYQQV